MTRLENVWGQTHPFYTLKKGYDELKSGEDEIAINFVATATERK